MRAAIVDLNNFSRYPTMSVGYLAAVLRQKGADVEVLSPFSFGVHGFPRHVREKRWQLYFNFLKHWSAVSRLEPVRQLRARLKRKQRPMGVEDSRQLLKAVGGLLDRKPDVVLISAYTMYLDVCRDIAGLCRGKGIPVLVGGNSFVISDIAKLWSDVSGIEAVYAGEPEPLLYELVEELSKGRDVSHLPGVYSPEKGEDFAAKPVVDLNAIPFPDFSDFPWNSYPNRIVPIMTGRGCGWGLCSFCSDVVTAAARTFRSRSLDNVLEEVRQQRERYNSNLFVFLDLKLNSNLALWRGLADNLPKVAPGIKWTASVHVDTRRDNGLSAADLQHAADAGLVRITCGLESGSQQVLNSMAKGMKLQGMSEYVQGAHAAGISVRLTCILGYPAERPEDIERTRRFLEAHAPYVERVAVHRFTHMPGIPVQAKLEQPDEYPHIKLHDLDLENAVFAHENARLAEVGNLKAVYRLMKVVNKINCKPILKIAEEFEGAF